jgi:hypothetical protein
MTNAVLVLGPYWAKIRMPRHGFGQSGVALRAALVSS